MKNRSENIVKTSENQETWFDKLGLQEINKEALRDLATGRLDNKPENIDGDHRTFWDNQNIFSSAAFGYNEIVRIVGLLRKNGLETRNGYNDMIDEMSVFILPPDDEKANAAVLVSMNSKRRNGQTLGSESTLYVSTKQLKKMDKKIQDIIDTLFKNEDETNGNDNFSVSFVGYDGPYSGSILKLLEDQLDEKVLEK